MLLAIAMLQTSALAASPQSGKISTKVPSVRWKGGPFYVSRPVGCLGPGDATCDYFFLKVNLGEGAKVEIRLTTPKPAYGGAPPVSGDDYDIYVWGPDDNIIAEGANIGQGNETLTFTQHARLRNYAYEVEIVPYLVAPGSTYTAKARALTRGH